MSTTVAIICEYNPFHNGHLYQIEQIRKDFGSDTGIIAIMSGNFTQRGEIAIADKGNRAKCALLSGVDLVLELPFPFSMSSAEIFASAGVKIADSLGIVDNLSFGSESGDIEALYRISEMQMSEKYEMTLKKLIESSDCKNIGYPTLCQMALQATSSDIPNISPTPNNILAIEYIKALIRSSSAIKPHTISRCGSAFDEEKIRNNGFESATAIRARIDAGDYSALDYIPKAAKDVLLCAKNKGAFPCTESQLDSAVISSFRLNSSLIDADIADAAGGLYNRLQALSLEANNIQTLIRLAETKKFTRARIRRAVWYSFLGVTSSELKALPLYTQLLAANEKGRMMLKEIRKRGRIPVLTKPSDTDSLSAEALAEKERSDRADSVFQLTKPIPADGCYAVRFTPYVK